MGGQPFMNTLSEFKEIAPYLTNPLTLVGYVLLLVFGMHRALLKARIIPTLSARTGGLVVKTILRYGFVIALAVIVLGFGLAFYQAHVEHSPAAEEQEIQRARISGL